VFVIVLYNLVLYVGNCLSADNCAKSVCHQVTCVEVIDAFVARVKEVNPLINTVVADRFEDARKDAAEVDRVLDSGSVPDGLSEQNAPYLGVPFTAKEALSIAGIVTSYSYGKIELLLLLLLTYVL